MTLTNAEIAKAKARTDYSGEVSHEHNDCIRIAYEWLDAQKIVKVAKERDVALNEIITKWGGMPISQADVEVAATLLHPRITGKYPSFNLSVRYMVPNDRRLEGIRKALKKDYRKHFRPEDYARLEP